MLQLRLGIGILLAASADGRRRALRARSPIHRPRNPVRFDTRHKRLGVKSGEAVWSSSPRGCWKTQPQLGRDGHGR